MTIDHQKIEGELEKILPEIIQIRQHLHANPELSLEEYAMLEDKVKAGKNLFRFNRHQLLAGTYILSIEGEQTRVQRQFVVQP